MKDVQIAPPDVHLDEPREVKPMRFRRLTVRLNLLVVGRI